MLIERMGKAGCKTNQVLHGYDLFYENDVHPQPPDASEVPLKCDMGLEMEKMTFSSRLALDQSCNALQGAKVDNGDEFNPYEDNSGTALCLKQEDFIVVAGDTRHSSEMVINSRKMSKIFKVKDFLLTGTGFYADSYEVYIKMVYEIRRYEVDGPISIHSAANLLSKILYSKRFFPYYSYCSLSGFDNGKPYVYAYDPLGSFKAVSCICNGSGSSMIQPLLDSFVDKKNWNNADCREISQEDAVRLVVKAFGAAAERDVKTKDCLEIYVMRKEGLAYSTVTLRKD